MDGSQKGGEFDPNDPNAMMHQQQMNEMYAQQQQQLQMSMAPAHDWAELDDHYKMVDEAAIEPDYYIDRPVSATFFCLSRTDYRVN